MKKFLVLLLETACLLGAGYAVANDGGKVILDLQDETSVQSTKDDIPAVIEMGVNYWNDVKEYDELLDGENLNKDFSADIMAKYPNYSKQSAEIWQQYVKKGIKGYRFYKDVKQKVVNWLLNREMPLVVDDNQYEMGEPEKYVESDKPLVIKDFKKVVAYSGNERDQLAAQEKYAKDHNITRPSEIITRYKKALLEKDWAKIFGIDWEKYWQSNYGQPNKTEDINNPAAASVILSQFNGIGADGKIAGVVLVEIKMPTLALLGSYKEYQGMQIDFAQSKNFAQNKVEFVLPQILQDKNDITITGYTGKFPIYFEGQAVDAQNPVELKAEVKMNLCRADECKQIVLGPEMILQPEEEAKETSFAAYVRTVAQNIPQEKNAENFEFDRLMVVDDAQSGERFLQLEIKSDDAALFKVFIWGEEAKYFAKANIRIDDDRLVVRFPIIDQTFDPQGKEINFWVATKGNNQYIGKATVIEKTNAYRDDVIWLKVLWLALIGGILLNLMPLGLVAAIYKVIGITKFGGKNRQKIRKDFCKTAIGIVCGFGIWAAIYAQLAASGYAVSFAMQLQNSVFVALLIWISVAMLWHVFRILPVGKMGAIKNQELLKGMGLAVLAACLFAPYLGEALCIATAYGQMFAAAVMIGAGMGMALPYVIVGIWPQICFAVPKAGKWIKKLLAVAAVALLVLIVWEMNILYNQTSTAEIWRWVVYLVIATMAGLFYKVLMNEIDKLKDRKIAAILSYRINIIFKTIMTLVVGISLIDAAMSAKQVEQVVFTELNQKLVDDDVEHGRKVMVKIEARWCILCKLNNVLVFDNADMQAELNRNNVKVLEIDWTKYNADIFELMQKYERLGPPFYILFSKKFPDGIVLPQMLNINDLKTMIRM